MRGEDLCRLRNGFAVMAWIAGTEMDSGASSHDRLAIPKRTRSQRHGLNLVPQIRQPFSYKFRYRFFDLDVTAIETYLRKSPGFQRLLNGQAIIHNIGHELCVRLSLVPSPHDAKTDVHVTFLHESRNDRVQGALTPGEHIWMAFFRREQRAAILQHKTCAVRYHARAKTSIVALNEGHDIAILVDDRHINRIFSLRVGYAHRAFSAFTDAFSAFRRMLLVQQLVNLSL